MIQKGIRKRRKLARKRQQEERKEEEGEEGEEGERFEGFVPFKPFLLQQILQSPSSLPPHKEKMASEWSLQETVIFEISPDTPVSMETGQEPSNVFVTEATWNASGDHFCVAGSNGDVKLYNYASERGASLSLRIHHGHVVSPRVRFDHVDPNFLWTCADDGEVRMWDLRTSSVAMAYRVGEKKKQKNLLSCDVTRDRSLVAAGSAIASDDAIIYFW